MTTQTLWPILLTAALTALFTGVSVAIGFAFAVTRQIGGIKSDIRNLGTEFKDWKERCDIRHNPIDEKLKDLKTTVTETKALADKALAMSRENADGLANLK